MCHGSSKWNQNVLFSKECILAKCLYYGKIHFYKKVVLFYLGVDTGKVLWIDFLRPKPQSYDLTEIYIGPVLNNLKPRVLRESNYSKSIVQCYNSELRRDANNHAWRSKKRPVSKPALESNNNKFKKRYLFYKVSQIQFVKPVSGHLKW